MEQKFNNEQSETKSFDNAQDKKPKGKKIITVVIFLIIILAVIYVLGTEGARWWQERQKWIKMGFASDKFPFRMYTEEELAKKGLWAAESPALINTPTRTRPEQTYAKFRQALIDGDMNKAAECFVQEQQEEWEKSLYEIKEKNLLQGMLNDLPEQLEDTYRGGIPIENIEAIDLDHVALFSCEYIVIKNNKNYSHSISFSKNWDGDWLIEDL